MSYKFDDKSKEGLKRGEKLFNKVVRDRQVLENAEEDLADYYEKTMKTSPGLELGNKIFSNASEECGVIKPGTKDKCLDPKGHSGPHATFFGNEWTDEKKNEEKSYMPNGCSGPNGCSAKQMAKENLTSSDGEAGSSHLSKDNKKETCSQCGGSGSIRDPHEDKAGLAGGLPSIGCPTCHGTGKTDKKENGDPEGFRGVVGLDNGTDCEECGHSLRSHNQYGCSECPGGGKCGLNPEEDQGDYPNAKAICEKCSNEHPASSPCYPHDLYENAKMGLKKGASKYGTVKNSDNMCVCGHDEKDHDLSGSACSIHDCKCAKYGFAG